MQNHRLAALMATALALVGACDEPDPAPRPCSSTSLSEGMVPLDEAIDCGDVTRLASDAEREAQANCVMGAQEAGVAFRYGEFPGIDGGSWVFTGTAEPDLDVAILRSSHGESADVKSVHSCTHIERLEPCGAANVSCLRCESYSSVCSGP